MNTRITPTHHQPSRRPIGGFSLVELMVALVLGLIIIAGVGSTLLSSMRSYDTTEALSAIQSNSRIAFEFMGRDIRQAGLTGCDSGSPRVANVLNGGPNNGGTSWWANWNNAVRGYDGGAADPAVTTGTGTADRVAGTDSLQLLGAQGASITITSHNATAASIHVHSSGNYLEAGDIIIACNPDHAAIVQITNVSGSSPNKTLVHNTGTGIPGNCSKGLGFPTTCTTNGNSYSFPKNSRVFKLGGFDWYIGYNAAGGKSLYRLVFDAVSGSGSPAEMVRNVTDMQIKYHVGSSTTFSDAASVTNWSSVNAIRVTLTLESAADHVTTNGAGAKLTREFTFTVTVRNRA